jgi:hypothetical protein
VCGLLIGHPADTIKVRQQTFQSSRCIHIAIQTIKYEGVSLGVKGILNYKASQISISHILDESTNQTLRYSLRVKYFSAVKRRPVILVLKCHIMKAHGEGTP